MRTARFSRGRQSRNAVLSAVGDVRKMVVFAVRLLSRPRRPGRAYHGRNTRSFTASTNPRRNPSRWNARNASTGSGVATSRWGKLNNRPARGITGRFQRAPIGLLKRSSAMVVGMKRGIGNMPSIECVRLPASRPCDVYKRRDGLCLDARQDSQKSGYNTPANSSGK